MHTGLIGMYEELPGMQLKEEENKAKEARGLSLNYSKFPR
jgi:hypothetical protein